MIYLFDRLDEMTEIDYCRCLSMLPEERQKKARRYLSAPDQYACVLSYLLLCHGLRVEYGITGPVYFGYGEHGKPYCRDYPQFYFNISHCRYGVACAISDRETGIDMQDIRWTPVRESLAKRVLSSDEFRIWKESENPDRLFYRYWTIKESYLKQKGTGLLEKMSGLEAEGLIRRPATQAFYMENERYCLSVFGSEAAEAQFASLTALIESA